MNEASAIGAIFDGSIEGFMCVIFAHYYQKLSFGHICIEADYQPQIDTEYMFISSDSEKAHRVFNAIKKKISERAEYHVYHCFYSHEPTRFDLLYRYLIKGFKLGADVDAHMHDDTVLGVHKLARYVSREAHLLKGFCRFAKTAEGIYYAVITPVNFPLPILAEHFRDRLMDQAWIIHDKTHHMAAVYDGFDYVIAPVPPEAQVNLSEDEPNYQALWKTFFNTIGIKARLNPRLQRNLLPLRYRGNMTEFND